MPVLKEMSKETGVRTKFNFVAIPQAKAGKGWAEDEALILFGVDTYHNDWDGEMRLSAHWREVRASMEQHIKKTTPDADDNPMDDEPLEVYVPAKETLHAVSMNAKAEKVLAWNNTQPDNFQWDVNAREGYFRYDPKKRKAEPITAETVKAFEQAIENRLNNSDVGTDKPGGMLFVKKYAKNRATFAEWVGRSVKWELRLAEAS